MAKPRYVGARKSADNLVSTQKEAKKRCAKVWSASQGAPMFKKISRSKGPDGVRETVRTNRLISGPAYKIALSGAAQYVSAVLREDAKIYGMKGAKTESACPWQPSLSRGAIAMLEQFLCAIGQQGNKAAVAIRKMQGKERLSPQMVRLGFEAANKAVFASASNATENLINVPLDKKPAQAKKRAEPAD